jgi:hypothetical protein
MGVQRTKQEAVGQVIEGIAPDQSINIQPEKV